MTSTDQTMEAAIVAAGANVAPRITPTDIEAAIWSEHYFTAADGVNGALDREADHPIRIDPTSPLGLVTICVLTMNNGTKVVGVNEGPVSPENFKPELGRQYARQKAIDQIWPMLGYELRSRLAAA